MAWLTPPARTGRDKEIKYRPEEQHKPGGDSIIKPADAMRDTVKQRIEHAGFPASPLPTSSRMPLAKPTSKAGAIIILAPSVNEDAITLTVIPLRRKITPMRPITTPMVKNWLAISGINRRGQSRPRRPKSLRRSGPAVPASHRR